MICLCTVILREYNNSIRNILGGPQNISPMSSKILNSALCLVSLSFFLTFLSSTSLTSKVCLIINFPNLKSVLNKSWNQKYSILYTSICWWLIFHNRETNTFTISIYLPYNIKITLSQTCYFRANRNQCAGLKKSFLNHFSFLPSKIN